MHTHTVRISGHEFNIAIDREVVGVATFSRFQVEALQIANSPKSIVASRPQALENRNWWLDHLVLPI